MSLEGRLRDLGLPEICQLISSSRKSGTLHVNAPLMARAARLHFDHGFVTDAAQWSLHAGSPHDAEFSLPIADARRVESYVLDLLTWPDGEFRFSAHAGVVAPATGIRLAIEGLLVESAHRASVWEAISDRVANARVVPAFVDVEPQQLPLLRLVPQEWEVLTRVDGRRDLNELAVVLERSVLDVAQIVHALIGAGLLTVTERVVDARKLDTPPTQQPAMLDEYVAEAPSGVDDIWSEQTAAVFDADAFGAAAFHANAFDTDVASDDLFDPIALGVVDEHSIPYRVLATTPDIAPQSAPASGASSHDRSDPDWPSATWNAATLCVQGDEAARHGDLAGALTCWSMALRRRETLHDADRIREAIALSARLHALLHPSPR